jgi:RNA polymerase sigma factor (sigma-70 family)
MRTIPSAPSADDPSPAGRLHGVSSLPTRELLDRVVESGYTGCWWEELARRLFDSAFYDLERSIRSDTIYERCRRVKIGIPRRQELQQHPRAQEIALEAVGECLEEFRTRVLPQGVWDPDRSTTLETFFASCCLRQVANLWRRHLRQLSPDALEFDSLEQAGQAGILGLVADHSSDPAVVVEARDLLTRALGSMSTSDRLSFVLREQGWSLAEIAQILDIGRNTLDVRMSRARKAAQAEEESGE